jgi:hypothetical protein
MAKWRAALAAAGLLTGTLVNLTPPAAHAGTNPNTWSGCNHFGYFYDFDSSAWIRPNHTYAGNLGDELTADASSPSAWTEYDLCDNGTSSGYYFLFDPGVSGYNEDSWTTRADGYSRESLTRNGATFAVKCYSYGSSYAFAIDDEGSNGGWLQTTTISGEYFLVPHSSSGFPFEFYDPSSGADQLCH